MTKKPKEIREAMNPEEIVEAYLNEKAFQKFEGLSENIQFLKDRCKGMLIDIAEIAFSEGKNSKMRK